MILLTLFVVCMFLWLLSLLPIPNPPGNFNWASPWLAFFAVLFLGLSMFWVRI